MSVAQGATAAPPEQAHRSQTSENAVVRAVARIPLPLGAKLLIGFALVAGLLALVAALRLVALGQSNSRAEKLRRLQQTAAYARLLEGATRWPEPQGFRQTR